jgi:hypothetical protein
LNRDSRERVKAAVLGLLDSITAKQVTDTDSDDSTAIEDSEGDDILDG